MERFEGELAQEGLFPPGPRFTPAGDSGGNHLPRIRAKQQWALSLCARKVSLPLPTEQTWLCAALVGGTGGRWLDAWQERVRLPEAGLAGPGREL